MKLLSAEIEKFTRFRTRTTFDFSPGVNVFVGRNGTGKSHLLKILYTALETNRRAEQINADDDAQLAFLRDKLAGVFRPDEMAVGRLVSRTVGRSKARVEITSDQGHFKFTVSTLGKVAVVEDTFPLTEAAVFLPSREALAMYEGFARAYRERELAFDETYFDLCLQLSGSQLRGPRLDRARKLAEPLEQILGGAVRLVGGRFVLLSAGENLEAHLLAEGHRKIASLVQLVLNGSLIQNGFLFWDEPEANLNPLLITKIARMLRLLAATGVQVFVSTHDYLLASELSLASQFEREYPKEERCQIRFFALSAASDDTVRVASGSRLADLGGNEIVDEFAAHFDRRAELLSRHGKRRVESDE